MESSLGVLGNFREIGSCVYYLYLHTFKPTYRERLDNRGTNKFFRDSHPTVSTVHWPTSKGANSDEVGMNNIAQDVYRLMRIT
jgi:hypothetical protein